MRVLRHCGKHNLIGVENNGSPVGDHAVLNKPDCWYGPQVIEMILRKPRKITILLYLCFYNYCV